MRPCITRRSCSRGSPGRFPPDGRRRTARRLEFRAGERRVVIGEQLLVADAYVAGFDKHPDSDPLVADAGAAPMTPGSCGSAAPFQCAGQLRRGCRRQQRAAGVENDHAGLFGAFETHGRTRSLDIRGPPPHHAATPVSISRRPAFEQLAGFPASSCAETEKGPREFFAESAAKWFLTPLSRTFLSR